MKYKQRGNYRDRMEILEEIIIKKTIKTKKKILGIFKSDGFVGKILNIFKRD